MAGLVGAYERYLRIRFYRLQRSRRGVTIAGCVTTNPSQGDRVAVSQGIGWRRHLGRGTRFPCRACRCRNTGADQAEIGALLPSYGATRNPIVSPAQGVHSGGLQKSIDLLDVSDEVDAILVVLSLSERHKDAVQAGGLKPVIDAQNSRSCFTPTRCHPTSRAPNRASGAVCCRG